VELLIMISQRLLLATLLIGALPACSEVLGIEHAELASTSAAPSGPPRPSALTICHRAPTEACADCLSAECGILPQECVSVSNCRRQLEEHARCKGNNCDGQPETCGAKIADVSLQDCVFACADECPTNVVSRCEAYCGCMGEYCPEARATLGDCVETCKGWSDELRECQLQHCEFVQGMDDRKSPHCGHAIGAPKVCEEFAERPIASRSACLTGKESNWPCEESSECCSDECLASDTCR
jgi:hypothetical protein